MAGGEELHAHGPHPLGDALAIKTAFKAAHVERQWIHAKDRHAEPCGDKMHEILRHLAERPEVASQLFFVKTVSAPTDVFIRHMCGAKHRPEDRTLYDFSLWHLHLLS